MRILQHNFFEKLIWRGLICLFLLACCAFQSRAISFEARVEIPKPGSRQVKIEGKIGDAKSTFDGKRWSFLDAYADVNNLSGRISNLTLFDASGRTLPVRKIAPGEFETASAAVGFQYEINLEIPAEQAATAHISWLGDNRGLLMLSDLLPQFPAGEKHPGRIEFLLPKDWKIATNETRIGEISFSTADAESAIFLIGADFKERTGWHGKTEIRLAFGGDWTFTDEEVIGMASRIVEEHRRTFGDAATNRLQIILLPFPRTSPADRWRAETRGTTIVLISGSSPFKSIALNRLHEQLRHEIFHLWIPNALNLSGQYDWFYEGFTLYQALKTGVRLEQIRFEDFLDTMSRAFDATRTVQPTDLSLVEASRRRWNGSAGLVYGKGMVVAFLSDVALLRESGGKRSLADVFREIFKKHRQNSARENGNAAVIAHLKKYPELNLIVTKYVESSAPVEWAEEIATLGLLHDENARQTRLRVNSKLNGRQRSLLEKLGYRREFSSAFFPLREHQREQFPASAQLP